MHLISQNERLDANVRLRGSMAQFALRADNFKPGECYRDETKDGEAAFGNMNFHDWDVTVIQNFVNNDVPYTMRGNTLMYIKGIGVFLQGQFDHLDLSNLKIAGCNETDYPALLFDRTFICNSLRMDNIQFPGTTTNIRKQVAFLCVANRLGTRSGSFFDTPDFQTGIGLGDTYGGPAHGAVVVEPFSWILPTDAWHMTGLNRYLHFYPGTALVHELTYAASAVGQVGQLVINNTDTVAHTVRLNVGYYAVWGSDGNNGRDVVIAPGATVSIKVQCNPTAIDHYVNYSAPAA